MKKILITLLLSTSAIAQRTLPNPIILVHGFTANKNTWTPFTNYLRSNLGLTISPTLLTYDLNCDGNNATAQILMDVCQINTGTIGNYDVYVVDFEVNGNNTKYKYSNQASATKQGYALKYAIERVLAATGADRVSLLGHSMGGLAIREYAQNPIHYQDNDKQHHIAKIATIGTPHGGSNQGSLNLNLGSLFGKDEFSEAGRDLKTTTLNGKSGVYLFGGYENAATLGNGYFNYDIDNNGRTGDLIVGLNQRPFPENIDAACVIGGIDSDLVVTTKSQNLNNIYPVIWAKVFNYNCQFTETCHTEEPKMAFSEMVQALDEPYKLLTSLKQGVSTKGIFAKEIQDANIDDDEYYIYVSEKGKINVTFNGVPSAQTLIRFYDIENRQMFFQQNITNVNFTIDADKPGFYKILLHGETPNSISTYFVKYTFTPTPPPIVVTSTTPTKPTVSALYPNPNNGSFWVESSSNITSIDIFDQLGNLLQSTEAQSNRQRIELNSACNCILRINATEGSKSIRFLSQK